MPAEPAPAFDALRCPGDRGALARRDDALACARCGAAYPIVDGIPDFVRDASASTARWRAAQRYELAYWRDADPAREGRDDARWADAARVLAERFEAVAPGAGAARVLHVGPAGRGEIHRLPADERWAVEPLAIELARLGRLDRTGVRYVAAMGEGLPFADDFFGAAVMPNVLDHVADPARLLAELRRCLAPGAPAWITCHVVPPAVAPAFALAARSRAGYFAGHPWSFTAARLDALVTDAGFAIVDATAAPGEATGERRLRARLKARLLGSRYLLATA